jgi:hypothetical protein
MTTTASSTRSGLPQHVLRVVRAVVLATTSLTVAAAAHASAGGELPDGAGLSVLGALTVALATLVARARSRVLVQVPFLVVVQVLLHHGFALLAAPAGTPRGAVALPAGMPGHASAPGFAADHAAHALTTSSGGLLVGAAEHAHVAHAVGPAMLGAHAAAVVVTAAVLAASERAAALAFSLWTWLVPVLLGAALPVPASRPGSVPRVERVVRPFARAARSVVSRRGPPAAPPVFA